MNSRKKKNKAPWEKKLNKAIAGIIKEKKKTAKTKEKIHRKAVKNRKKKIEKTVDGLLIGGCFLVCLTAAFMEAKENGRIGK